LQKQVSTDIRIYVSGQGIIRPREFGRVKPCINSSQSDNQPL
jgi:hypothetical protein